MYSFYVQYVSSSFSIVSLILPMKASPLGQNGFSIRLGCVIGESQVCLQVYRSSAKANMRNISQIEKTPALNCTTRTAQQDVWALPCEDSCCDLIWSGTEWNMATNCQNGLNACCFLWCLLHIRNRASTLHKYNFIATVCDVQRAKETWRSWGEFDERRRSRVKYSS